MDQIRRNNRNSNPSNLTITSKFLQELITQVITLKYWLDVLAQFVRENHKRIIVYIICLTRPILYRGGQK